MTLGPVDGETREAERPTDDCNFGDLGGDMVVQILNAVADPLFVKDDQHRWLAVNDAFAALMGRDRAELLGKSDFDFFPKEEAQVFWAKDEEVFRSGATNLNQESFTNASGTQFIETKKSLVSTADGRRVLVGTIRDVTEVVEARSRLQQALDAAGLATWTMRAGARQVVGDERFAALIGRADVRPNEPFELETLVEPEDRDELKRVLEQAAEEGALAWVHRVRRDDGEVVFLRQRAQFHGIDGEGRFIGCAQDVTADMRAAEALQRASREARAASVAKSSFLATMSHEIRTPLNAVLGYTQLLARDLTLAPQQREQVMTIHASGKHLLSLLNDVLDMSKIESGRMQARLNWVDVRGLVAEAVGAFRARAEEKGLGLRTIEEGALPQQVYTDADKVRQILGNLVGNALKFTERGEIAVTLKATQRNEQYTSISVEVRDDGRGIPEDEHARLFRPFEQGQEMRDTAGGTGLGLAISARLAELIGGELSLVGSSVPGGSTFNVSFLAKHSFEPVRTSQRSRIPTGLAGGSPRGPILVVDDRQSNRDLLVALLQSVGVDAQTASDGAQALEAVQACSPLAVLMDVRMPVMDGEEATRRLRLMPQHTQLPIIAVSASVLDFDVARQKELGFNDFLRKPIEAEHVFDALARHTPLIFEYGAPSEPTRAVATHEELLVAMQRLTVDQRAALRGWLELLDFEGFCGALREMSGLSERVRCRAERYASDFDQERLLSVLEGDL